MIGRDHDHDVPPFLAALATFVIVSLLVLGLMTMVHPLPKEIHAEVGTAAPPAPDSTYARQDSLRHTI